MNITLSTHRYSTVDDDSNILIYIETVCKELSELRDEQP